MPRRHRIWRVVAALPGSVLFCLRYLPLRQAVRLPIMIAHTHTRVRMSGKVRIEGPLKPGMIKIGFGWIPLFDWRRERGVWDVTGEVVFKGPIMIRHGVKLCVYGRLELGSQVIVAPESCILCADEITIGDETSIAWQVLIMDTDSHEIDGQQPTAPIAIGDHVLIGARSTILKGSRLPDAAIVGAASCVTRHTAIEERDGIGGNPAHVLRSQIEWVR